VFTELLIPLQPTDARLSLTADPTPVVTGILIARVPSTEGTDEDGAVRLNAPTGCFFDPFEIMRPPYVAAAPLLRVLLEFPRKICLRRFRRWKFLEATAIVSG
jgi:hypothetical protein